MIHTSVHDPPTTTKFVGFLGTLNLNLLSLESYITKYVNGHKDIHPLHFVQFPLCNVYSIIVCFMDKRLWVPSLSYMIGLYVVCFETWGGAVSKHVRSNH